MPCQQGVLVHRHSEIRERRSVKILFIAWAIFSVIILANYTANLTSFLTVQVGLLKQCTWLAHSKWHAPTASTSYRLQSVTTEVNSLEDLFLSHKPFGTAKYSEMQAYFETSTDPLARSLADRMILYSGGALLMEWLPPGCTRGNVSSSIHPARQTALDPLVICIADVSEALEDLESGKIAAYIHISSYIKHLASHPPCHFEIAEDEFGPGILVLGMPKNSSYTSAMKIALLSLMEDGTFTGAWDICGVRQGSPLYSATLAQLRALTMPWLDAAPPPFSSITSEHGQCAAVQRRWLASGCEDHASATIGNASLDVADLWGVFLVLVSQALMFDDQS